MAEKRSVRGPFRPGAGSPPPYLAGREDEQALFLDLLTDLGNGIPPPADVVLHGPRGNGKTSLLAWLEEEAASRSRLDVVLLAPSQCRTEEALAGRLLSASWWKRLSPAESSGKDLTWRPGDGPAPAADEVLTARASRRPLLLVLDEAHTLASAVGDSLLNASQMVRRRQPFLLVLAGTPGLRRHLGRMGASFWSRSQAVPIGRLDSDDSAAAIERPLQEEGVGLDREARDRIVGESHGYPYFLQLWGQVVWQRLRNVVGPARRVTETIVDAARPDFDSQKDFYFQDAPSSSESIGFRRRGPLRRPFAPNRSWTTRGCSGPSTAGSGRRLLEERSSRPSRPSSPWVTSGGHEGPSAGNPGSPA